MPRTAGPTCACRLTPAARLCVTASGFGARPVAPPTTLVEAIAQRGGTLRASHEPETNFASVEIYLPLVLGVRAGDTPFPLLRSDRHTTTERS